MSFISKATKKLLVTICRQLDTPTLLVLCSTSRVWREPTQAVLFNTIKFLDLFPTSRSNNIHQRLNQLRCCIEARPDLGHNVRHILYADIKATEASEDFINIVKLAPGLQSLTFSPMNWETNNILIRQYREAFTSLPFTELTVHLGSHDRIVYVPSKPLKSLTLVGRDAYHPGFDEYFGRDHTHQVDFTSFKIRSSRLILKSCKNYDSHGLGTNEWNLSTCLSEHATSPKELHLEDCTINYKGLARVLSTCGDQLEDLALLRTRVPDDSAMQFSSVPALELFRWASWTPKLVSLDIGNNTVPSLGQLQSVRHLTWRQGPQDSAQVSLQKLVSILESGFGMQLSKLSLVGRLYEIYKQDGGWSGDTWGKQSNGASEDAQGRLHSCRALLAYFDEACRTRKLTLEPSNYIADCSAILDAYDLIAKATGRIAGNHDGNTFDEAPPFETLGGAWL